MAPYDYGADEDNDAALEADDTEFEEDLADYKSVMTGTTSITSSMLSYTYENGRRYVSGSHARPGAGQYLLPNDEEEQDRLDMTHHVWMMLYQGRSHMAPLKNPKRALDCGTGTGIWAVDFGDQYPECEVLGVDISPIQPSWMPPNVRFEVDDVEADWVHEKDYFDYIHTRNLIGSITDWPNYVKTIYDHLAPGGWAEFHEADGSRFHCDDGSLKDENPMQQYMKQTFAAMVKTNTAYSPFKVRDDMKAAGFVDVVIEKSKLPCGTWPKEKTLKDLGRWGKVMMETGLESYGLGLLTRGLGLTAEEALHLIDTAVEEAKRVRAHAYWITYAVYGRKPLPAETPTSPKSPQSPRSPKSPRSPRSPR